MCSLQLYMGGVQMAALLDNIISTIFGSLLMFTFLTRSAKMDSYPILLGGWMKPASEKTKTWLIIGRVDH